tara:strand:+ start:73 stop:651 length:579 start_codon:yes stop_codon:yes gene_type:complete
MSFQERYEKHKNFIQERWLPFSVKVMLEKDPKNKISIIRAAQKQAAKEIQDIEVQSTFIEFLNWEIEYLQGPLNQEDSASPTQAHQRNETLNTDESTQEGQYTGKTEPEKINWKGSQTQLAYLVQILLENGFIEHGDHWKMCAEHFLWQGKPIDNKKLAAAIGNVASINKDGKPKKAEILESIVSDISSLKK